MATANTQTGVRQQRRSVRPGLIGPQFGGQRLYYPSTELGVAVQQVHNTRKEPSPIAKHARRTESKPVVVAKPEKQPAPKVVKLSPTPQQKESKPVLTKAASKPPTEQERIDMLLGEIESDDRNWNKIATQISCTELFLISECVTAFLFYKGKSVECPPQLLRENVAEAGIAATEEKMKNSSVDGELCWYSHHLITLSSVFQDVSELVNAKELIVGLYVQKEWNFPPKLMDRINKLLQRTREQQ